MANVQIRKHMEWNWRSYFTPAVLNQAEQDEKYEKIKTFTSDPGGRWAMGTTTNGFRVRASKLPASYTECIEFDEWKMRQEYFYSARERKKQDRFSCNCSSRYFAGDFASRNISGRELEKTGGDL